MATIKSFADFNLDDILISEDYKAVDSADEEDLEKTSPDGDADDADTSAADPDYENDFEEQSEYAGSPQAALKYDAQRLNSLCDSGDNDTYEDDYHDASTTIQDGEGDAIVVPPPVSAASVAVNGHSIAQTVSGTVPMLGIASQDATEGKQKQAAQAPRSAASAAIPLVTTVHRDSSQGLSSDYFLNISADMDSASAGERPDTVVNMKSMPSKLRPNYDYGSNFSPPPLSPSAQRQGGPSSASPPASERSSVLFAPQRDLSQARSSASSFSSADRSLDATSNALRAIAARSTSISRGREAKPGPMSTKVSRVQVAQMDSSLQDMIDQDAAKKERARLAASKAVGRSGAAAGAVVGKSPTSGSVPAAAIRPASADYTAQNLLRSAVRKDGRARVSAVPAGFGGDAVLTADLLALVSDLVDARVAKRLAETESKRQFFGDLSRHAVRVPSSSGLAAPPKLGQGAAPVSVKDPEIRYNQDYQRERRQLSTGGDMTYCNSYEFTTVTSPRASVDREALAVPPAPIANPQVANVIAPPAAASAVSAAAPADPLPALTASPEALERFGGPAEAIYTSFLADVISTCKERAAQSRSAEEMVMHRCLAQRLFAHFGDGAEVLRYKDCMAAAALECVLKVEGGR
jgi:hypothetical protein